MNPPLRALVIEDNPADAELLTLELQRAGYDARCRRVETPEELRRALSEPWHIIYSDFQLIGFDALAALDIVRREKKSDVPFVVVSGSIGEDVAVDAMRAGADDYFCKEHLERLGPATARSLREADARRKAESAERRALEAERQLRQEAEAANRLKDEFLLTLSHELRTPLHVIQGWTTLMRRKATEEGRIRALDTIDRSARHLGRLIDELLDMSRMTTETLVMARRGLAFGPLVNAAIESVRPVAEARQIQLDCAVDASCLVYGDPGRLQQVVWNVLGNAIKFTPDHGSIGVRLAREGSEATLRVSDSGVGISAAFLPHVFERFRQADGSTTRRYGGLGLGLAIAKDIVERHGGAITAESAGEGKGATFTVRLPTWNGSPAEQEPQAAESSPFGLKNVRVLALEDDADSREFVCAALESSGAVVRPVASVPEALELLRTWRPDVLLCDIGLPGTDGYDFIRAVRAQAAEDGGWIPAAALTAHASPEAARRAKEAGYDVHLPKPFDVTQLLHVVDVLAESSPDHRR